MLLFCNSRDRAGPSGAASRVTRIAVDLRNLREFCQAWFDGLPVYDLATFKSRSLILYPPVAYPVLRLLAGWPRDITPLRWMWAAANAVAFVPFLRHLLHVAGPREVGQTVFCAAAVLSCNALGVLVGTGQISLVLVSAMLLACRLSASGGRVATDALVVVLAVVASIKPNVSVPLVWILLLGPRGFRRVTGVAVVFLAISLLGAHFQPASLAFLMRYSVITTERQAGDLETD